MIPKIIHYCWFGGNKMPPLAEKCIKSWKRYCKGYELQLWNESNYDITSAPLYVQQAYAAKKWAFVTDYVRLQVVYEHGGIYLDTDVKVIKPLDGLLRYHAYFGFEDEKYIATGLGFGAEKGSSIVKEVMDDYRDIPFMREDGTFDTEPCPQRNTRVFLKHGLVQGGSMQMLPGGVCILPREYLCPIDYSTGYRKITRKTLSIHLYDASWVSDTMKKKQQQWRKIRRKANRREYIRYFPNRILQRILGQERYNLLKNRRTDKQRSP